VEIQRVTVNILDKQSWTFTAGYYPSSEGLAIGLTTLHCKTVMFYETYNRILELYRFFIITQQCVREFLFGVLELWRITL
jgi:hypothetical protein